MQHWDRIEAFVEVVRLGSFAPAARDLGVSSRHVSRLVARLDVNQTIPCDAIAYRFDIVLRGRRSTLFENRLEGN